MRRREFITGSSAWSESPYDESDPKKTFAGPLTRLCIRAPLKRHRYSRRYIEGNAMTEFSRRSLLSGAAVAGAATVVASSSGQAVVPPANKQAPGFYRYKV